MKKPRLLSLIVALLILSPVCASQEETYSPGLKRTTDYSIGITDFSSEISQKTMTAEELCALYDIGLTDGFPLYQPEHGQPMNVSYIWYHGYKQGKKCAVSI